MTKQFTNNFFIINLYKKPTIKSEVVTQMLYGDSFSIIKKSRRWVKIKIKEDGYIGYIKNNNFPNKKIKINEIPFGSKIKVIESKAMFIKFSKGWIRKKDVKPISYKEKNLFRKISIFKNIKYKWGGKSYKGIDCSGLIQIFFNFNNKFCPRDAKDQVKFFKKNVKLDDIKRNDIIFWKGHVALALSNKRLIHAYGPVKKTVIMDIDKTINKIKKTANLNVIGIKRI